MWTSGGAILRDLSRAQGGARGAHAELRALRPRDRPPPPRRRSEEMEEDWRALAPAPAPAPRDDEPGPDLRHIQQMLNMVRKLNIPEEEIANDEAFTDSLDSYAIERSRSPRACRAERAAGAARSPPDLPEPKIHKKRRRNIALESILQALESSERDEAIHCTSEPYTLLKPQDLINTLPENVNKNTGAAEHTNTEDAVNTSSQSKIDSNDRVNYLMNRMMSPIQRKPQSREVVGAGIDPCSMFKKKVKSGLGSPSSKLSSDVSKGTASPANGASYVPSGDASLCYQRYLANNKQILMRREEASQLAALITEAFERAAQAEATKRAALEGTEGAALAEDGTEGVVQSSRVMQWVVQSAPARVRLAAPRACAPRERCLVCARLTRAPQTPRSVSLTPRARSVSLTRSPLPAPPHRARSASL